MRPERRKTPPREPAVTKLEITHYVHMHHSPQLDRIEKAVLSMFTQGARIMKELDDLTTEVSENTTVVGSAIALIEGFDERLAAAGTDPAKLNDLRNQLSSSKVALAKAVAEHTAAASEPPPRVDPPVDPGTVNQI